MVTARWEQGLDGKSAPADYAAVIAAPAAAPAPPPPANMFTEIVGALRPLAADGNWRSTLRNRAGTVRPSPRSSAPRASRQRAPASHPPRPAAVQDIYGPWTPWISVAQSLAQPRPRAGSARERDVDAGRARKRIGLRHVARHRVPVGLAHPHAPADHLRGPDVRGRDLRHSAPEPRPAGFDRSLAGGGAALVVTFSGALPSAPGRDDHFAHKTARTTPAASALRKAAIRDATGSRSRVCRSTSARPDSSVLRSGQEDRS
jgi:hypothetical protein